MKVVIGGSEMLHLKKYVSGLIFFLIIHLDLKKQRENKEKTK